MARQLKIFDTTLRDGEQSPGCSLNLQEKIEIARQLERLGVDVIEAGFAIASPGDFAAVQQVAESVKECTVASLARALPKDIDCSWEAIRNAAQPRIHTFIATSDVHLKYKLRMTREQVLQQAADMVRYAHKYCSDVEFSAEDALRSDPTFLYQVFEAVISAGASVINVPDTVGYTTPAEMSNLITSIRNNVPNIDTVDLAVHCHNDLGLAVANTLAAAQAGVSQLECTINGLGERAGNAALEEIVMALFTRKNYYDMECGIDTTQIFRTSRLVSSLTGVQVQPNKAVVGGNAFAHEAGIHQHGVLANQSTYEIMTPESIGLSKSKMVLGKHSGKHAFEDRVQELGYSLTSEALQEALDQFKVLADKKKVVSDRDIDAILSQKTASIVPKTYHLERFVINSGNTITSTAAVTLRKDDELLEAVASGDGSIDAAMKAIDKMIGIEFRLDDFGIQSVTEGKDAQGDVVVRISKNGRSYNGRGLSTDIIEASVIAYLNAINKLLYDLERKKEASNHGK